MNRLTTFLAGIVVGAIGIYGSMHFYIVQSKDGVQLVRKVTPVAEFPYVDVRSFTMADWQKHGQLTVALTKAGKSKIFSESASSSIGNTVSSTIDNWSNDQNWPQ